MILLMAMMFAMAPGAPTTPYSATPSSPPHWHDGRFDFGMSVPVAGYAIDRSLDCRTWVEWLRCPGGVVTVVDCEAGGARGFYRVRVL